LQKQLVAARISSGGKHLFEVFEPLSPEQEEAIARVWPRQVVNEIRIPPRLLFHASILHYLAGNREMAIIRTKDWLAHMGPAEKREREQAQAQLNSLERIH